MFKDTCLVHRSNYSAERMVLVVLGGEPLDVLEQWVKALFLAVPSGRGPRPVFDHLGRPYTVQHPYLLSDDAQRVHTPCTQGHASAVICPPRLGTSSGIGCTLMQWFAH